MTDSLDYRKDSRSIEEFKRDIKRDTFRELIAINILVAHLKDKNPKADIRFVDNGMDNSGKLIKDKKKVSAKADFRLFVNNKEDFIEVKVHSERYPFFTFKASNLKRYLSDNAIIAVITEEKCYLIPPRCNKFIQEYFEPSRYNNFASGKISYRLNKEDIALLESMKYIKIISWGSKAKKLVEFHKTIFEKRKLDD